MGIDWPPLARLRAREHRAFGDLVAGHYEPLRRYLARLVGDGDIAAELTQEAFLRAYQALPRLTDGSNVGGWLYRIGTNLARQHHRRGRLVCWSRLSQVPEERLSGRGPEDEVAGQDLVQRALARLSLEQRVCLLLYARTGYTCAEIGGITGKSTAAVRMLLVRARRRFRAAYGDLSVDPDLSGGASTPGSATPSGDVPRTGAAGGSRAAGAAGMEGVEGTQGVEGARGTEGSWGTEGSLGIEGAPGTGEAGMEALEGDRHGCCPARAALPFYPRGDLPRATFADVTRHLARCRSCCLALAEVQATYHLLQGQLGQTSAAGVPARRAAVLALAAPPFVAPPALRPEPLLQTLPLPVPKVLPLPVPLPVRRPG